MLQKPVMWSEAEEAKRCEYWDFAQANIAPRAGDPRRTRFRSN